MQKLQVIGNLGADAQVKSANGKQFVTFRIADTRKWTSADGQEHVETVWVNCIWTGDGGKVLPYLRQGAKVFVEGMPSYRVYSSEKLRCMVAGVDLNVVNIELCGGSSDDVPKRLVDPETSELIDVHKAYYIQMPKDYKPHDLISEAGKQFEMDKNGFVRPKADANS